MQIIPSILVSSQEEFSQQIMAVQKLLPLVQLDIADGQFVPQTTWAEPEIIKKQCQIDIELHLMVAKPLLELRRWASTEQIIRILIHYETVNNFKDILPTLHAYGWEIGVVLNPDTPFEVLEPYLQEIKTVMFMGVQPGKQAQKLIPAVLDKIQKFTNKYPDIFTEIDGGVNETTLPAIIKSGVKAVCPGSAIFKKGKSANENIKNMQKLINNLT